MPALPKAPTPTRAALAEHLDVRAGHARRPQTFYDTFDGRAVRRGLTLRHADGRLALLDRATGEELAAAEAPPRRGCSTTTSPSALRERLAARSRCAR